MDFNRARRLTAGTEVKLGPNASTYYGQGKVVERARTYPEDKLIYFVIEHTDGTTGFYSNYDLGVMH
jgi:hypothetical protein